MALIATYASGKTTNSGVEIFTGAGSPEGAQTGKPGDLYVNLSGGSGSTFWIKESGSGNTGWATPAGTGGAAFQQQIFAGTGTDTDFVCTVFGIELTDVITVQLQGAEKYEGASRDWTRDADTDKIKFNTAPINGAVIVVRKWR